MRRWGWPLGRLGALSCRQTAVCSVESAVRKLQSAGARRTLAHEPHAVNAAQISLRFPTAAAQRVGRRADTRPASDHYLLLAAIVVAQQASSSPRGFLAQLPPPRAAPSGHLAPPDSRKPRGPTRHKLARRTPAQVAGVQLLFDERAGNELLTLGEWPVRRARRWRQTVCRSLRAAGQATGTARPHLASGAELWRLFGLFWLPLARILSPSEMERWADGPGKWGSHFWRRDDKKRPHDWPPGWNATDAGWQKVHCISVQCISVQRSAQCISV